jgi:hypothetical protein
MAAAFKSADRPLFSEANRISPFPAGHGCGRGAGPDDPDFDIILKLVEKTLI